MLTKITLHYSIRLRQRYNIPLVLPLLKINNALTKRVDHIKFLGVLFDKNLTWKNHINLIESKISRKNVYVSFMDSCINYGNIAWGSTYKTKLKKIFTYQKKSSKVNLFSDHLAHAKPWCLTWMHSTFTKYIYIKTWF